MIKVTKVQVPQKLGTTLTMKKKQYIQDPIINKSAVKKEQIVNLISIGSQLTLIGTVLEQLGDSTGLDTPEFRQLKENYNIIKAIL